MQSTISIKVSKISRNHTEVEQILPPESDVVAALDHLLAERKTVTADRMVDFYDEVLAALQVDPPDELLYGYVIARVHSAACLTSKRFHWDDKKRAWVYRRLVLEVRSENYEVR